MSIDHKYQSNFRVSNALVNDDSVNDSAKSCTVTLERVTALLIITYTIQKDIHALRFYMLSYQDEICFPATLMFGLMNTCIMCTLLYLCANLHDSVANKFFWGMRSICFILLAYEYYGNQ